MRTLFRFMHAVNISGAVVATLAVLALLLGSASAAKASHLLAPTGLVCDATADPITLDWDDVTGAVKYSVDFKLTKTVDEVTTTIELSIGTSDRTDDGLMGDSDLDVTYAELEAVAGVGAGALVGFDVDAKVKALDPGKIKGRQNHGFSSPESGCGTIT